MKRFLNLFVFLLLLCVIFLHNLKTVNAQVPCTGDSGGSGVCTVAMSCPSTRIDGAGTCTGSEICCLDETTGGDGGTGGCSDTCTSSADCLDTPVNLDCIGGVCTGSTCTSCTGNSGSPGSCLAPVVCDGLGKNSEDGSGSCTTGYICCTNAPSTHSCTLSAPSTVVAGAEFQISLSSDLPNEYFYITTSPTNCYGTSPLVTDASGNRSASYMCDAVGSYTITAAAGATQCSTTVSAENIPGMPCVGDSGVSGYCRRDIICPNNYTPDGYCESPDVICCIPYASVISGELCGSEGINTAIGCIPVGDPNAFTSFLLGWGLGIGGGIAFVLMIYAGFLIITSSGMPQRLQAGKELLTSAITGLILMVFAVFLLRVLGVNILGIPGLD